MKCHYTTDAGICEECGFDLAAGEDRECTAEATFRELLDMELGIVQRRTVAVTNHQVMRLQQQVAMSHLSSLEVKELFPTAADDPTLIGNRLEMLFTQLGVPPCGGCLGRRDWLNSAHLLAREIWGLG